MSQETRYTIPPVLDPGRMWSLPGDLETERKVASDSSADLHDRLEALENIFDSEIGDTPLSRSRNVEREVTIRQLYLKFEGGNATGTQKDRIAFTQVADALRRGFAVITAASCGNYGVAISLAASCAGVRPVIYVPKSYHTRRVEEMEGLGADIVREGADYETAVAASRARAEREALYDANPGSSNSALQVKAYGEIANEIYDQLRDAPRVVAVPVSNGTTLAGIHKGFLSLYRRGKTSRIPMFVAGSSYGKNPIIHSFRQSLDSCAELEPESIRETETNEPLINWRSIDGDDALHAVRSTGGFAAYASDKRMKSISRFLREKEGLSVLPAATAGLAAMMELHQKSPFPADRFVAVLTGRK